MSESVNEQLNRIKSNIATTYSTLSDVGLINEEGGNSDNLASTIQNLSWGGGELCDIGLALFIDESAGMRRLLNGQILEIGSKFKPFLNKLQLIAGVYPNILCTETEWQAIKESSPFGQVGKFVLNYGETGENIVSVRLPAVVNLQGLQDLQYLGNKLDEALPNITGSMNNRGMTNQEEMVVEGAFYICSGGGGYGNTGASGNNRWGLGIDASRCSSAYKNNAHVQQEAIQYPYYIQVNLTEYNHMIDVGQIQDINDRTGILESKTDILENKVYLVDSYVSGNSWYRVYSDGWCEQGGRCSASNQTVNFLKTFKNTNYTITAGLIPGTSSATYEHLNIGSLSPSSFYYTCYDGYQLMWCAQGYVAL